MGKCTERIKKAIKMTVPWEAADILWSSEQASADKNLIPVCAPAFSDTPDFGKKIRCQIKPINVFTLCKILFSHLEEGTVWTLPPKTLGARLVVTVLLVDLQVGHLQGCSKKKWLSRNNIIFTSAFVCSHSPSVGNIFQPIQDSQCTAPAPSEMSCDT